MTGIQFQIKNRDIMGRVGEFNTPHGKVHTPTLLPVINPNIDLIPPRQIMERFGADILITNSYIINKTPRIKEKALETGVHELLDFPGAIMTDSGTFQSYVHGDVDVEPLEIVQFQKDIGVDIATILDIFSTPDRTFAEAKEDMERTLERAKISTKIKGETFLATTVQGSVYPELRETCATELSRGNIDGDVFPIGGVVPLMEDYRYAEMVDIVMASKRGLNISKPVHLFGAGHPMIFALASAMGCDLFDSSSYAKYAQDARMMFTDGTRKLKEMDHLPCTCPVCVKYQRAERLLELPFIEMKRELASHNLYVSFGELRRIKEAIISGTLWELVERRCSGHPMLYEALERLYTHFDQLELFEPASKKRMMLTGPFSLKRPEVQRIDNFLRERYIPMSDTCILLPDASKPYDVTYGSLINEINEILPAFIAVDTPLGPIPIELSHMYPFSQSLYPKHAGSSSNRPKVAEIWPQVKYVLKIRGEKPLAQVRIWVEELKDHVADKLYDESNKMSKHQRDILSIRSTLDMQFGSGIGDQIMKRNSEDIAFRKSKSTDRIRNVFFKEEHVFSVSASSGRITLKRKGALLLKKALIGKDYRVVMDKESAPFVRKGKTVFCKFVLGCDDNIRPGDEVILVDEEDNLLAWGKSLMNRKEMLDFQSGMAVKVRQGIDQV